jgi:hypothetical protein
MLDPVTGGVIVVLGKYAPDKGTELGKEVGPKALETAKEIFTAALQRLRRDPAGRVIADEYAADPDTYEKPVEKMLNETIADDADFKAEMEGLLRRFDEAAAAHAQATGQTYTAVLHGGGAIAQGEGATAVGERGVNVGGNVGGTIVTGSGNVINTGETAASPVSLPPALAPWRDKLVRHFNKSELKALCFDLGVAHDDLPGDTRSELAQALVAYCHRQERLPDLLQQCRTKRPHVAWDAV